MFDRDLQSVGEMPTFSYFLFYVFNNNKSQRGCAMSTNRDNYVFRKLKLLYHCELCFNFGFKNNYKLKTTKLQTTNAQNSILKF